VGTLRSHSELTATNEYEAGLREFFHESHVASCVA
jgi:hypothetical protein